MDVDGHTVVDIWGGWRDAAHRSPWTEDTITNVWSTTKTVTNLAALMLVDRGQLDPVRAGREVLAGVRRERQGAHRGSPPAEPHLGRVRLGPAVRRRGHVRLGPRPGAGRPDAVVAAGHRVGVPRQQPGSPGRRGRAPGDRPAAQGVRRQEIAGPLGADFQIGAAEPTGTGSRRLSRRPPLPFDLDALDPTARVQDLHRAGRRRGDGEHPGLAPGRHGRAQRPRQRPLGRPDPRIAGAGRRPSTGCACCPRTRSGYLRRAEPRADLVLGVPLRFGIGYALPETADVPYVPQGRACYWGGWGGSVILMDLDRRTTISYMMNKMGSRHHRVRPLRGVRAHHPGLPGLSGLAGAGLAWPGLAGRAGLRLSRAGRTPW